MTGNSPPPSWPPPAAWGLSSRPPSPLHRGGRVWHPAGRRDQLRRPPAPDRRALWDGGGAPGGTRLLRGGPPPDPLGPQGNLRLPAPGIPDGDHRVLTWSVWNKRAAVPRPARSDVFYPFDRLSLPDYNVKQPLF